MYSKIYHPRTVPGTARLLPTLNDQHSYILVVGYSRCHFRSLEVCGGCDAGRSSCSSRAPVVSVTDTLFLIWQILDEDLQGLRRRYHLLWWVTRITYPGPPYIPLSSRVYGVKHVAVDFWLAELTVNTGICKALTSNLESQSLLMALNSYLVHTSRVSLTRK